MSLNSKEPANQIGVIGVERDFGLPLALCLCRQAFRDIEETVDLAFLHSDTRIRHIAVMSYDTCLRESIQIADNVA